MRPKVKRSTDTMPELVEAFDSDESSDEENNGDMDEETIPSEEL